MANLPFGTSDSDYEQTWNQGRRARSTATESVVDEHSTFNGVYHTSQNLRIEGRYEGEIECEGLVTIAEQAVVNAKIRAESVTVAGRCEGEIDCENRFEVMPTGQVTGQVTAGMISIHEGARFDGQLTRVTGRSLEQRFGASDEGREESEEEARPSGPVSVNRRREAI
jgi:cytoskeletal protein CcmA (bactofilin family)